LNWGPTLALNIVAPYILYGILTGHSVGMAAVPALMLTSVCSLLDLGIYFLLHRKLDEFAIFTLAVLALGVLSMVAYNSTKAIFLKDSLLTGLIGLGYLGTLLLSRPAMFYFGRKFATDGTPAGVAYWNGLWQYEGFRRGQRLLTVIWGVAFLVESGLRIALTYVLSTHTMLLVTNILPYAFIGGLVYFTIVYGKRRGAAMRASLEAEQQGEAAGSAVPLADPA
jgi:hypothetical protein